MNKTRELSTTGKLVVEKHFVISYVESVILEDICMLKSEEYVCKT